MIALVLAIGSAALIAWVYAGYPLALMLLGRLRPRPRLVAPVEPSLSVLIAAHDEVAVIAAKVANVFASDYPAELLEVIVASDGSEDGTVDAARGAGATVLDLPRMGKLSALNRAADSLGLPDRLVDDTNDIKLISQIINKITNDTKTIRSAGRSTSGVKLLNLDADDKIAAAVTISPEDPKTPPENGTLLQ